MTARGVIHNRDAARQIQDFSVVFEDKRKGKEGGAP